MRQKLGFSGEARRTEFDDWIKWRNRGGYKRSAGEGGVIRFLFPQFREGSVCWLPFGERKGHYGAAL
jgi:hypothetical protein